MPRPTEHITDYPDYSDEAERQRRALIDSLERDEDDVFDSKRGNFQDSRPTTIQDTRPSDYHDRKYDDSYDRRPDNVYDRRRDDLYDRSRASNGYNDTHRAGSGGYSDSSRASTPRSPERIRADTPSAPPNRMAMPVDIVPPQRDLVPLWDGSPFYGTPDTPASPLDCNRWPSSPYCGGNPFDWKPFGISVDAVNDGGSAVNKEGCNIGIQVTPVVMFVKMPPIQIVARNPWCKPEPPREDAQPTVQLPKNFDGEFGTPGKLYKLKFKAKEIAYQNAYYCPPGGGNPTKPIKYVLFPQLNPITELNVTVTGPVRLQILHSRADELIGNTVDYYGQGQCGIVGTNKTTRYNGYDKQILVSVRHGNGNTIYLYVESQRIMSEFARKVGTFTKEGQQLNMIWTSGEHDVLEFNLDDIPQDIPRYAPPPPKPPWEPPPPPPEPRQRRDAPEECECMCCNDGNTEALIAMLMQQLANQAGQIANLQAQITSSTNTILNSQRPVDLSPVLNDTTLIKRGLESVTTITQLTATETRLTEKIDKIKVDLTPVLNDTKLIKDKLDNVKVDLKPVLDKLENIDEDVAKLSGNLGVFPGAFNDGDGGELTFNNHAELVYEVYKALDRKFSLMSEKQGDLLALIGEPLEIELYDDDLSQVGIQAKAVTPLTLFESIAFSTTRGEIALKGIGVEQYPIKYKVGEEEKEINNLSALTWAIARAIPVDIFPYTFKWKVKDHLGIEWEHEHKFENLSDLLLKLIGAPVGVMLFDEDTEKEGRQPKLMVPKNLFEIIGLVSKRAETLAEVIGIDMFPITLKPHFSEDALINLNVLGEDRSILDQVLDLLGTIDPFSWLLDFQGTLQGTMDLAGDAWNILNAIISQYSETKKLHNLVELMNFTRELIIESSDEDGFPIVVEKEQIDGTEDLVFDSKADAIEEILTLLYNLAKTNGYQTDIGLKCLAESVHGKAISAMVQGEVRNIADFLDYPTNAVVQQLKVHINCPAKELADGDVDIGENFERFLQESEIDITFDEWTGKRSFMDMMRDLLNQAASARGDATRRIGG